MNSLTSAYSFVKELPVYTSLLAGADTWRGGPPILTKEHIAKGFPENWMTPLLRKALQDREIEFATSSGTTSDRLQILRRKNWWLDEYRRTYRHIPQLEGFLVGEDPKAILTTAICSNAACFLDSPEYEARVHNQTLYLNTTPDPNRWTREDIARIAAELTRFAPVYLDADPIYLALFLHFADRFGIAVSVPALKVLTLSYELVPGLVRTYIEHRLGIPAINLYGTTETGYLFAEAPDGSLRRCPELSRVELSPFMPDQGLYRVLVTSLKNEFMPLLRYDVGDLVKVDMTHQQVRAHGNGDTAPVRYFCGRVRDVVSTPNGAVLSTGDLDAAVTARGPDILFYQAVLRDDGFVLFRYVRGNGESLSREDESRIRDALAEVTAGDFQAEFARATAIAPEHSGKFAVLKRH